MDVPHTSVKVMCTVHDRIQAAKLGPLMEDLEEAGGADHPLSVISTLEKIMSLTRLDGNSALSAALLEWIFFDTLNCLRSGFLDRAAKRDEMLPFSKSSLLGRRCCFYLLQKLTYAGSSMNADREGFLANFMSHRDFLNGGFHDGADQTRLSQLFPFQTEALYAFRLLFSGNGDLHTELLEAVSKDANLSAEQALQLPEIKRLINLDHLLELLSSNMCCGLVSIFGKFMD